MEFGAVFPTCEIGSDPAAIRDFAQAAEDLGYAGLVMYDHVLGAVGDDRVPPLLGPYREYDEFHEPLVTCGFVAAVTQTIELATGVLVLPQRQTALVAKQVAQVEILSRGRFRLGVGSGWNHVEYESLGVPFGERGERISEQIEVLRALWDEPVVDHDGRFHRIDRAGIAPRPASRIPIWFGGSGSGVALRRAARMGDGFIAPSSGPTMEPLVEQLLGMLDEEGRSGDAFGFEALLDYSKGPEAWAQEIEAWARIGGTRISMRAMSNTAEIFGVEAPGFSSPGEHIRALETFIEAVR